MKPKTEQQPPFRAMLPDLIVPLPACVSRRAWECAIDLGSEHSCVLGAAALWHMLQSLVVQRDPELLTWAEAGLVFRAHRHVRGVRQ